MRDKTWLDQAVPEKFSDPFGIGYIGFASRYIFDALGIGKGNVEVAFEHIVNGTPVNAGTSMAI
ncbi:hypothetical protein GCM10020370_19110 [Paenibacillus hodogayensis]